MRSQKLLQREDFSLSTVNKSKFQDDCLKFQVLVFISQFGHKCQLPELMAIDFFFPLTTH